jgi:hypothetical protein
MVSTKHLLDHIDALVRISHDVQDRAISAKLREMADELRILVSVADVANLAANFGNAPAVVPAAPVAQPAPAAAPALNEMVAALYESKPKRKRKPKEAKEKEDSDTPRPKGKRKSKKRADGD